MREEDFVMRKIVLPSGKSVEIIYFGEALEKLQPMEKPMEDYVEEFVDALSLDLILPEDFG